MADRKNSGDYGALLNVAFNPFTALFNHCYFFQVLSAAQQTF